ERAGYREPPVDTEYGWDVGSEYLTYARSTWNRDQTLAALASGRTRTALFWYRTSPATLVPSASNNRPTQEDPPFVVSDMRLVRLDAHGRLVEFHSIPPQVEDPAATGAAPDWAQLFEAAALTPAAFHDVEPLWTPHGLADARRAWEGPLPDVPNVTVRIEAAAYRGRPIFFTVLPPWTRPGRMVQAPRSAIGRMLTAFSVVIAFAILAVAALLARRHLRTGRGDSQGAFRTAAVTFVTLAARHARFAERAGPAWRALRPFADAADNPAGARRRDAARVRRRFPQDHRQAHVARAAAGHVRHPADRDERHICCGAPADRAD